MKNYQHIASFFLRLSIAAGFISASADRFGWWGINGAKGVSWGDWQHFVNYTNVLLPFAPPALANVFAITATVAEIVIAVQLAIGFYTRIAACSAGLLALFFALSMTFTLGIKAPFSYSVFIVSAAGFLLATIPTYKWSMDEIRLKKNYLTQLFFTNKSIKMKSIIIAAMLAATTLTVAAQSKIYSKQATYVLKETEAEGVDAHVGVFKINAASQKATYTLYYWANGMAYKNHVLADSTHFKLKAKVKIEVPAGATAEEVRNAISKNILDAINKENVPDILKMRLTAFFTGAVNDKYKIAASKADHIFFPVWADNRINGIKLRQGNFEIRKD